MFMLIHMHVHRLLTLLAVSRVFIVIHNDLFFFCCFPYGVSPTTIKIVLHLCKYVVL